jgi:hypothetical protein
MRSPREHCLVVINRLQGEDGVAAFLRAPQPALGDRTGGQLLQADPEELLRRLQALEAAHEIRDMEDIYADPVFDRMPQRRAKKEINRLFETLDKIQNGRAKA